MFVILIYIYLMGIIFFGFGSWYYWPKDKVTWKLMLMEIIAVIIWPIFAPLVLYLSWREGR